MTHAPLPWHFDSNRDEVTIYADNDWPIARMIGHCDVQNARRIVEAVNRTAPAATNTNDE